LKRERQFSQPVQSTTDPYQLLKADFSGENHELQAWSVLYYHYVFVALDLTGSQIAELVGESIRTITRRQQIGIVRLLHILIRRELRSLEQQRKTQLLACLPLPVAPKLYGRDGQFRWAVNYLLNASPSHLCITGPQGVGKSVFALALSHFLINTLPLQRVVWIDDCPLDPDRLIAILTERLEVTDSLSQDLQRHPTLIVLDNFQSPKDMSKLSQIQQHIGAAYALMVTTSDVKVDDKPHLAYMRLRGLDEATSLQWLLTRTYIPEEDQQMFYKKFQRAFERFGGNPSALQHEFSVL
jgi:hypothetical protein